MEEKRLMEKKRDSKEEQRALGSQKRKRTMIRYSQLGKVGDQSTEGCIHENAVSRTSDLQKSEYDAGYRSKAMTRLRW